MITREDILNLANQQHDVCISIYMPTHKMGENIQQDPIRFKNLLGEVEEQLKLHEVPDQQVSALLEEPRKWLDRKMFWQNNDEGLAVFISEENFSFYRIAGSLEEQVMVDTHFLITPLIPMISLEGSFCLLALSQKKVRLLRATRDTISRFRLKDIPTNMKEFTKFNEQEPTLQHHAGQSPGRAHGKGEIFHGHGSEADGVRREVINYLKQIENGVTAFLRRRNDPLVLAGVEEAVAEYRKINHYSRLLEEAVIRNPDDLSNEELRDKGWEIIQSYFLKDMYADMERFGDLIGSDKQSDNLTNIVEAAYYGKIDSLFVPIGEQSWGWFDEDRDVVHHSTEPKNGEHDLINMAAIKTLTQSGNVYALDKEEMPNGTSIAAIFRYA